MDEAEKIEQIERIAGYTTLLNSTITDSDDHVELLAFVVAEVIDRMKLYLNRIDVPVEMERTVAKVVASVFNKYNETKDKTDVEHDVSSVSDNGQSVSYSSNVKSYLTSSSDDSLFTDVEPLLTRYRRLNYGNSPGV